MIDTPCATISFVMERLLVDKLYLFVHAPEGIENTIILRSLPLLANTEGFINVNDAHRIVLTRNM